MNYIRFIRRHKGLLYVLSLRASIPLEKFISDRARRVRLTSWENGLRKSETDFFILVIFHFLIHFLFPSLATGLLSRCVQRVPSRWCLCSRDKFFKFTWESAESMSGDRWRKRSFYLPNDGRVRDVHKGGATPFTPTSSEFTRNETLTVSLTLIMPWIILY